MNPFDLHGPEFLYFYGLVAGSALVLGLVIRSTCRAPTGEPDPEAATLSPSEWAYLADGEARATQAAIANLARRDLLIFDGDARTLLRVGHAPPADASEVEIAVWKSASESAGRNFDTIRKSTRVALWPLRQRLTDMGLLTSGFPAFVGRWIPIVLMTTVIAVGVIQIGLGLSNKRPVLYLVAAVVITGLVTTFALGDAIHRSKQGDLALKRAVAANAALRTQASTRFDQLSAADAILAVGLFGTACLGTSSPVGFQSFLLPPPTASGSGCSSGSSCGGGCGGGGCGGCGG